MNHLNNTDWSLLYDLNIHQIHVMLTGHFHNSLDIYTTEKVMKIPH